MWSMSRKWRNYRFLVIIVQKLWRYLVRFKRWTKLSWSNHLNWTLWWPWSNLWSISCRKSWSRKNRGRKNCKRTSDTRCERTRRNRGTKVTRERTIINGWKSCKKGGRIGPNDSCSCWWRSRRCYFDHHHHRHFIQKEKLTIGIETKAKGKVCEWTKWLATRRRNSHASKCFKQWI